MKNTLCFSGVIVGTLNLTFGQLNVVFYPYPPPENTPASLPIVQSTGCTIALVTTSHPGGKSNNAPKPARSGGLFSCLQAARIAPRIAGSSYTRTPAAAQVGRLGARARQLAAQDTGGAR